MMPKRRVNVRHKRSRVLLSELLPYEVPVAFSNTGFYKFLNQSKIKFTASHIVFEEGDNAAIKTVLKIIFGKDVQIEHAIYDGKRCLQISRKHFKRSTMPFHFEIRHGDRNSRRLSVMHPMSQIAFIDLYDRHKVSFLYHTSRSPYSVRYPYRLTRYTVVRDSVFDELLEVGPGSVETSDREYDRIRSFFVYKEFDNVHKLYDSDEYRENEKKFGHLLRLDVSKCFDSIYTHSITWALFDKEAVKRDMHNHESTFGGEFDEAIRLANDNETHGIVIGPEISRIFAEIILQRVDREVDFSLRNKSVVHGSDYKVMRYVDDYFIFLRDPALRDVVVNELVTQLRPYRLHLNDAKEAVHSTPFISDISIAKDRLYRKLASHLRIEANTVEGELTPSELNFRSSASHLVGIYKTILRENNLGPLEVVNFSLASIEIQLEKVIGFYSSNANNQSSSDGEVGLANVRLARERVLIRALTAGLELSFFVYGGSPRVAPAIKLVRIIALIRKFGQNIGISSDARDTLDDFIFRELIVQLKRNPLSEGASVESLYLLSILSELGDQYLVEVSDLCQFVAISLDNKNRLLVPHWFNVFIVIELFRYMALHAIYDDVRRALESWLVDRIHSLDASSQKRRSAEQPFCVLSAISSPFISRSTKTAILSLYGAHAAGIDSVAEIQDEWFVGWKGFDLHSELLMKRVQEVY